MLLKEEKSGHEKGNLKGNKRAGEITEKERSAERTTERLFGRSYRKGFYGGWSVFLFFAINEQISNFAQTYPTNLKASSNEALLFMRRYRFANCSCFSCCFKDAYPSSNVQ